MNITFTYGIHLTNTMGRAVAVDPLLPPKKCPLDCIICPLGSSAGKPKDMEGLKTPPANVLLADYKNNKPADFTHDVMFLWGFGDPLILPDIHEKLADLKKLLIEEGVDVKLAVHTSLLRRKVLNEVVHVVDIIEVPYLWFGDQLSILGWPESASFSAYTETLKYLNKTASSKVLVKVYVFRIGSRMYPAVSDLEELILVLSSTRTDKVILKSLNRPSPGHATKQSSQSHVEAVVEELSKNGIRVILEQEALPEKPLQWSRLANNLYNHLLRTPLTLREIKGLYGDLGIIALTNLASKKKVVHLYWGKQVYYWAPFTPFLARSFPQT